VTHSPRDRRLAGVDEAGRGPLAGPVTAACVILDPERPIPGLADSKALSPARRERLADAIRQHALAWSVAEASVDEIGQLNILQATMLAMRRAVEGLQMTPTEVLVDGNRCPVIAHPVRAIVRGDALVPEISAASILAKTARDAVMLTIHRDHPQYGFDRHKGYPTADHLEALQRHGVTRHHRRGFAPVRDVLDAARRAAESLDGGMYA
jgi:ribonuclease HII